MPATQKSLDVVSAVEVSSRSVVIYFNGPRLELAVLTPRIIRVRFSPDGTLSPRRSWDPTRPDEEYQPFDCQIRETEISIEVQTGLISASFQKATGTITFFDPHGKQFCTDERGITWQEKSEFPGAGPEKISIWKQISPAEHFFGFGERTGYLDKTGKTMVNWATDPKPGHGPGTDPMYIAIPVFISVQPGLAYGFFLNQTGYSQWDMGHGNPAIWNAETTQDELNYTLIYGPSPAEVMEGISNTLGRIPLPPLWALGYHQSRWGYDSAETIRDIIANFRSRQIPCDVIHFDIDYMDGFRVFTWNPDRFPDPKSLLSELTQKGFHSVAIVDPGVKIDPQYPVYQEGIRDDNFIHDASGELAHGNVWPDDSVFPDFSRSDVRRWWGRQQQKLSDAGINGIWNDMNEPTLFSLPFSQGGGAIGTLPPDAVQGEPGEKVQHAQIHNLYGSLMARASYDGLRLANPEERPFVLTRSAYAGIQRWSACWMGDNNAWWEHLELSISQLINMGLSGEPFVGVDIGGFGNNASPELFARWIELGALYPFCRGHSAAGTLNCEPWRFGAQVESIAKEYLRLRYRLLPYFYSLFWEASQTGSPIMRPLFYHFPDDAATYPIHDQFLTGPFLMAAPIYQPGRCHRTAYFPAGSWFDWWSGQRIEGPSHQLLEAPLEKLPLFVRAGAIIPTGPDLEYTGQKQRSQLTLDLFPGDGEFRLYEDDGHTFAYLQGASAITSLQLRRENDRIRFEISARQGAFQPPERHILLRFHDVPAQPHMDGRYDPQTRTFTCEIPDTGQTQSLILAGI